MKLFVGTTLLFVGRYCSRYWAGVTFLLAMVVLDCSLYFGRCFSNNAALRLLLILRMASIAGDCCAKSYSFLGLIIRDITTLKGLLCLRHASVVMCPRAKV